VTTVTGTLPPAARIERAVAAHGNRGLLRRCLPPGVLKAKAIRRRSDKLKRLAARKANRAEAEAAGAKVAELQARHDLGSMPGMAYAISTWVLLGRSLAPQGRRRPVMQDRQLLGSA